ncbi:hypothetical protein [Enhygromyxa salina]|uniref:hypothetical protein n=1 Tax=Enhygromyxa salina TaxID=215803 RepID=UPI0011BA5BC7|nr:hypothetical protein [Enhygromyxa salina]
MTALAALTKPAAKAFVQKIKELAEANDARARAEYRKSIEAMVVEMYPAWTKFDEDERPLLDDFLDAARELNEEYSRARSNRKRELLNRAFLGRFNPRLYSEGMAEILWDYVLRLEYPEACLLAELVTEVKGRLAKVDLSTQYIPDGHPRAKYRANQVQISKSDAKYELSRRLRAQSLVEIEEHTFVVNVAPVLGLAEQLMEFIWGDGDTEPHSE